MHKIITDFLSILLIFMQHCNKTATKKAISFEAAFLQRQIIIIIIIKQNRHVQSAVLPVHNYNR